MKLGKILFLPPLKLGLQCIYCSKRLCYLILNCTMMPGSDGEKISDNAIILRYNTGSDILIDIIIWLESNLHPSDENLYALKTSADVLCRLQWCPNLMPIDWTRLIFFFLFFPKVCKPDKWFLFTTAPAHQCCYKIQGWSLRETNFVCVRPK